MIKVANLKALSLRKNFMWNFSSNIVNGLVQWGIVIVIAKYGTPELVGQYSLATGLVLPVFAFLNLNLRVVYVTDPQVRVQFGDYFWLRVCTIITALFLIVIFPFILGYDSKLLLVAVAYGFVRGAKALSDILFAPAQKRERMNFMALSIIIRSLVSFLIVFCTIHFTGNLVLAIFLMSAWELCVAIFFDYRVARFFSESHFAVKPGRFKKIIKKSYPLGIALGLTFLIGSIPRFIVEHYLGIKSAGYFGAIQYFYVASGLLITAINSASIPRLSKYYAADELDLFYSLLRKLFIFGFVFGVASIVFFSVSGRFILEFFYAGDYRLYSRELMIIIVAASVQYLVAIAASGILAMNRFWNMVFVLVAGLVSIIILGIVFVAQYSMMGAVYSMLVSSFLQLLIVLYFLYIGKTELIKPA